MSAPPTTPTLLLSRVAERLYWAGRYLERAEGTARLVRTHTELFVDLPRTAGIGWAPLLAVTGSDEAFRDGHDCVVEDEVVHFLLADPAHPGSVVSSVAQARENLRVTRGLIPRPSWEVVNDLHHRVQSSAAAGHARGARQLWAEDVIQRCHTFHGCVSATMSRDPAYAFLEIGRLVERADMTTRVLDVQAGILMGAVDDGLQAYVDLTWMAVLRSLGGELMYRRKLGAFVSPADVVAFLLRDTVFPRSVEHCLIDIARWLLELPDHTEPMAGTVTVQRQLDAAEVDALGVDDLHRLGDDLQVGLGALHECIQRTYFASTSLANA